MPAKIIVISLIYVTFFMISVVVVVVASVFVVIVASVTVVIEVPVAVIIVVLVITMPNFFMCIDTFFKMRLFMFVRFI